MSDVQDASTDDVPAIPPEVTYTRRHVAGDSPVPPQSMIAQNTTINGLSVCRPTCNVNKLHDVAKLDITLPEELSNVQRLAYAILEDFGFDDLRIEEFLDIIRDSLKEDGELPPANNAIQWPACIDEFLDAVQAACEVQTNASLEPVRKLLNKIREDGEEYLVISCLEILLKFETNQLKFEFIKMIIEGTLSKEIAATVYNDEFCSQFTTLDQNSKWCDGKLLEEPHKLMLQTFLEQIRDLISVRIYFRVEQLVEALDSDVHEFKFTIAAAKLLMAGHDTQSGDEVGVSQQIKYYLRPDEAMYKLFRPILTASIKRASGHRVSTSSSTDAAVEDQTVVNL